MASIAGLLTAAAIALGVKNFAVGADKTPDDRAIDSKLDSKRDQPPGYSLEGARDRAKVMHDVYSATLEVMHHRYFHGDRAVVPARAMEDIFSAIKRQSRVEARWISVNMKPMSIEHAPQSEFEQRAAKEIASGKEAFETVEEGYYRRAGAIRLTDGCISCHGGFALAPSKSPKFAGLVISVPIHGGGAADSK
ncbi:MAG: DUF3365 domain-containing protein [Pirellulaceae bacterium]